MYIDIYRCIQIYTDVYRYTCIQIYTDVYRYIQMYIDIYRYIQICTDIYRYIQIPRWDLPFSSSVCPRSLRPAAQVPGGIIAVTGHTPAYSVRVTVTVTAAGPGRGSQPGWAHPDRAEVTRRGVDSLVVTVIIRVMCRVARPCRTGPENRQASQ